MILFYAAGASSLAPHILLREAQIPFSLERVDLASHSWSGGSYNRINPKSYVPALELQDGDVLTECAVILQFIADLKIERKFLPAQGSRDRYHALEWLNFIATEIHKNFITPERHGGVAANFLSKTAKGQQDTRAVVSPRLEFVNQILHGQNYLIGETFGAPDSYLFVMLTWAQRLDMDISVWPNLMNYFERISSMASVREARAVEGPPHSLRD